MKEIGKIFMPSYIEKRWTEHWFKIGCFNKRVDPAKDSFCVLMPPPNVTGVLHMGHLLNQTLQDVFVRWARHCGKCATWIPGTDHAGISTQVKVEKELSLQGVNIKEIGREKFLEHAYNWRDKHGNVILSQLKSLGVSCDFENKIHTLDQDYSRGVLNAFVELYRRGYIYRGKRMINWCPVTMTALSDEEITMVPQHSKLYYVKYEIVEKPGKFIEIATTRPETIMGDVAIAVNPDDERYQSLVGMHCKRPLCPAHIPIIADAAVDKNFGTGALKITPAHDAIDLEIGQRHNLPPIDVINPDGTMNDLAGVKFAGLDRFVARERVERELRETGLLTQIKTYENSVGFSERGHVPIEPRLSEQWFLKYPKVEEAKRAISEGLIEFFPQRWEKTYLHWLENIKDWCISRQLWWGHRIPVWYRKGCDRNDNSSWHVSVEGPSDPENWEQEEDVLDTWASSWIWPFGVFGWPDQEKMAEKSFQFFYPTDILVTGPDIIFFWVARMVMASLELLGPGQQTLTDEQIAARVPFRKVYFTGIVRDKIGRKMSKSLGNSPEPLDLIAKYGADGVRIGVLMSAPKGQDLIFNEDNLVLGRNFCTKLWNAFRFSHMNREYKSFAKTSLEELVALIDPSDMDLDDHSILLNLVEFRERVGKALDKLDVYAAINHLTSFFWNEYCDWYVEASKARLRDNNKTVLAIHDIVLRQFLIMLNAFAPFITEHLWATDSNPDIEIVEHSGSMQDVYCETADDIRKNFGNLRLKHESIAIIGHCKELINAVRRLIVESKQKKSKTILTIFPKDEISKETIDAYIDKIKKLTGAEEIRWTYSMLQLPSVQTPFGIAFIEGEKLRDIKEIKAIRLKMRKLTSFIKTGKIRLSDHNFRAKAPAHVVDGIQKGLDENIAKYNELKKLLRSLS